MNGLLYLEYDEHWKKGRVGLIYTDGLRFVLEELGNAINRRVDKSQTKILGNALISKFWQPVCSISPTFCQFTTEEVQKLSHNSPHRQLTPCSPPRIFFLVNILHLHIWPFIFLQILVIARQGKNLVYANFWGLFFFYFQVRSNCLKLKHQTSTAVKLYLQNLPSEI